MEEFPRGQLLQRDTVYSGRIVELVVDTIQLDGKEHLREVVRHPGGVVFLGELENGLIPFVRQHRYPMNQVLLELPAGKIDLDEEPAVSAAREMEEETGLRPLETQHVCSFYATPGFCDEKLHLFHSSKLQESNPNLESDEHLVVEFHTLDEALDMVLRGQIQDAKTLVALFWLHWKRTLTSPAPGT